MNANSNIIIAAALNAKRPFIYRWKDKKNYVKALIKAGMFLIKASRG